MRQVEFGLEELLPTNILYSLRMDYNEKANTFEYVLHASLPSGQVADISLGKDLGDVLAVNWKQNEYGSFLGRHNMDWIIMCLSNGRPI